MNRFDWSSVPACRSCASSSAVLLARASSELSVAVAKRGATNATAELVHCACPSIPYDSQSKWAMGNKIAATWLVLREAAASALGNLGEHAAPALPQLTKLRRQQYQGAA